MLSERIALHELCFFHHHHHHHYNHHRHCILKRFFVSHFICTRLTCCVCTVAVAIALVFFLPSLLLSIFFSFSSVSLSRRFVPYRSLAFSFISIVSVNSQSNFNPSPELRDQVQKTGRFCEYTSLADCCCCCCCGGCCCLFFFSFLSLFMCPIGSMNS